MSKKVVVMISVFTLLVFVSFAPLAQVSAFKPGYNIDNYLAITEPSIDGEWDPADEWTDAEERKLEGLLDVYFRLKYAWTDSTVYQYILIDFVNDTTDDAADGFSLCFDAHHDGGTAPQTDDYMISVQGHSISGLTVYQGDGVEWVETTEFTWGTDLVIVNNLRSSPAEDTPHWVVEFRINSTWLDLLNDYWLRVAAFDDSSGTGNNVWPDSYAGTPDDYGLATTKFTQIPEFPHAALFLTLMAALVPIAYIARRRAFNLKTAR